MPRKRAQFGTITEENIDAYLEYIVGESKGGYVVQTIAFSKKDPRQMNLLRAALVSSANFSGLVKDALNLYLSANGQAKPIISRPIKSVRNEEPIKEQQTLMKNESSRRGFM